MKLTKPERGVGFFVDQPLVPIKIIDEVRPIPNFVMTSKVACSSHYFLVENFCNFS